MESDSENKVKGTESAVKVLQAALFPPQLTCSGSYFSNYLVKCQYEDDDEQKYKIRDSSSKDWSLNKDISFTLQAARWPTECQVLPETVKHISYVPPSWEPYYVATGNECQPKPTGDECGIIVYQYTPISAVNYFSRSSVGGSNYLLSTNLCPEQDSLKFESRFESANLARAIMITPNFYELHLRADLYTNRHMQWFYFRITNTKKGFLYRFSITNCSKESSLYNEGMKPLMYSTKDSQLHSIGWRRCGHNITYFCNDNVIPEDSDQQMTYTLSFTVKFPHDDDEVYLAQCYPYTYTDLQDHLSGIATHPVKSLFSSVRLLCKSLAGNSVYYVTITSPSNGDNKKKRAVVITARVHPGETPSSWMMKGVLDFLTSDSGPAKELRDKFIFKIVPMLNPDGVIVGNNRCSLSAKDLNRQYRTVMRDAYPSIWYTKLMVRRLLEECGVAMYCDFHAHSRKHNIFIYGCENRRSSEKRLQEQVFPLMLHKNTADKFSFESCKFRVQKNKEGTGRVVMWMMGISNSYTLEGSFAGSTLGNRAETHFTTQDYELMGKSFCQTLLDYYDDDPRKEKLRMKIIDRLAKEGSNADEPTNIRLSDYSSDEGGSSSTSDDVDRDQEIVIPAGPPPSPIIDFRKLRLKPAAPPKAKAVPKNPSTRRKPLPICKATLKLSLSEKQSINSDSSSSSDSETEKMNAFRRRRINMSMRKNKPVPDYSDSEVQTRSKRFISVFDLIPGDNLRSEIYIAKSKTSRIITDKKYQTTKQLTEVQAKLFSLKDKLWFGSGNGDSPIAWVNRSTLPKKKKMVPKKKKKQEKTEKVIKDVKPRVDQNEKTTKTQTGLRRQIAIDCPTQGKKISIRKSKSLPETPSNELVQCSSKCAISGDDDKQEKKKKKKRGKFVKKAKVISNAKQFTRKD